MQLAELFAVTYSFAALRSMSCFGDIVRRRHVKGAFGLATRFFLAYAFGVTRFIAGAFDFAPGFRARTLDFKSFLAGALGFAARLFTDTFGFAGLLPSARRFPHAPLALGLQSFLAQGFLAITFGFAGLRVGAASRSGLRACSRRGRSKRSLSCSRDMGRQPGGAARLRCGRAGANTDRADDRAPRTRARHSVSSAAAAASPCARTAMIAAARPRPRRPIG